MKTKRKLVLLSVIIGAMFLGSCNENKAGQQKRASLTENHKPNMEMTGTKKCGDCVDSPKSKGHEGMDHKMKSAVDNRIPLNISPKKAQHQLMNMRSHLMAVQSIVDYLSKDEFGKASEVASSKLGLTKEMKMMCSSFGNEKFEKLGIGFHQSADKMADVFKEGDKDKSLKALSATLGYCVECHSTFRQ